MAQMKACCILCIASQLRIGCTVAKKIDFANYYEKVQCVGHHLLDKIKTVTIIIQRTGVCPLGSEVDLKTFLTMGTLMLLPTQNFKFCLAVSRF